MLIKAFRTSYLGLFCSLLLFRNTIIEYAYLIIHRIPVIGEFSGLIIQVAITLLFFLTISQIIKRLTISDYMFYVISVTIILLQYTFLLNNTTYLDELITKIIFNILPYYFIGRLFNYNTSKKTITIFAYISISIFYFIRFILHSNQDFDYAGGDMGGAYTILPLILIITLNAYETRSIISICTSILGFILLFFLGNRGSMLYALLFIIILFFMNWRKNKTSTIIIVITFLLFFVLYFDIIISKTLNMIESLGFSPRIIELMLEGEINNDSGRNVIWKIIFNELYYHPWGLGITGDRIILNGKYCHNIFIEILSSFGIVIGLFINFTIVYLLLKAFICVRKTSEAGFYIALVCFGLFPLLTSMSFIEYNYFFILMGYSISLIKRYGGTKELSYNK